MNKIQLLTPNFIRQDNRGTLIELVNGVSLRNISIGESKKGSVMGNHYHKRTKVYFFIYQGKAKITLVNLKSKKTSELILNPNSGILIKTNQAHQIKFFKKSIYIICKSRDFSQVDSDFYPFLVNLPEPEKSKSTRIKS